MGRAASAGTGTERRAQKVADGAMVTTRPRMPGTSRHGRDASELDGMMTTRWARGSTGASARPRDSAVCRIDRSMTSSRAVPRARRRVARSARSRAAASTTRAPSGTRVSFAPPGVTVTAHSRSSLEEQAQQPGVGLLEQGPQRGHGDRSLLGGGCCGAGLLPVAPRHGALDLAGGRLEAVSHVGVGGNQHLRVQAPRVGGQPGDLGIG